MMLTGMVRTALAAAAGCLLLPGAPATDDGLALVRATRSAVEARFADSAAAEAAGYQPQPTIAPVVHFMRAAYERDSQPVDPARPAGLVYLRDGHHLRLVAAMFMLRSPGRAAPAVRGVESGWHSHSMCIGAGGLGIPVPGGGCPPATTAAVTAPMLHVWFVRVPGGPFAADMAPVALHCSVRHTAES